MGFKKFVASLTTGALLTGMLTVAMQSQQVFAAEDEVYVLMNIPYGEFYAAELNNNIAVDAVSSATKTKTRTAKLTSGSYHVDGTGESIDGVTFYVKASAEELAKLEAMGARVVKDSDTFEITTTNRGQQDTVTYTGSETLYEAPDYSYYKLSETPAYYKELDIAEDGMVSFGAIQGSYHTLATLNAGTDISYKYVSETSYGDYEIDFDTDEGAAVLANLFSYEKDKLYGVVIETTDGKQYGLRHLENVWLGTKLAWSVGITTTVHKCTLHFDQYVDMMGKTISSVTYLTSKGKVIINGLNVVLEEKVAPERWSAEQEAELTRLYAQGNALLANYDKSNATPAEGDLQTHIREASGMLGNPDTTAVAAAELIGELPGKIAEVEKERAATPVFSAPATADVAPFGMLLTTLMASFIMVLGIFGKKETR